MNILVTGSAGFIGNHLVSKLREAKHNVTCLDIQTPSGTSHVQGDLTNLNDLLAATKGIDAVCHLGGVGDVYLALEKPYLAAESNVVGTANLMEACLRNQVSKVIYTSTWEVYGNPQYQPIDEFHPCNPDHPYNITKLAGERIALSYDYLKDVPTIALRLGTTYGSQMRPNSVFSIFISRALQQQPLTIKGSGTQSRQFVHTSDVCCAFLQALESSFRGEVFNILGNENISIRHLAEMVADKIPTSIIYEKTRAGDIPSSLVSSNKARATLQWEPKVNFEQGLSKLIEWHIKEGLKTTLQ